MLEKRDTGSPGEEMPNVTAGTAAPRPVVHPVDVQQAVMRSATVPNSGYEREMMCRTWGQYNYESFDGLYFYFPGKCTYTLVRPCDDASHSSFAILVHNDAECRSSPYLCARSLSIFFPMERRLTLTGNDVTYNGQSLLLPQVIHDIEVEQITHYVLVTHQHKFTLAWDGTTSSVYIKMNPEYVGRTCGLCGNFNAEIEDDLQTSYDVFSPDIAVFANSWREVTPRDRPCAAVPANFPSPCEAQSSATLQKVHELCGVLLEIPFKECHAFVSPYPFLASCTNDLCSAGVDGDVLCQALTEYARACAHADYPLSDWRNQIDSCAAECEGEFVYRECITCCPASCHGAKLCAQSKLHCLDGCYCPEELIYENGSCVNISECPCLYHGAEFAPGQVVQEDCNNCTCVDGAWNCTDASCPGECSVTGDIHFQTFDGRTYTFQAPCQYILAKSASSGKFMVTLQNMPCGENLDGSCIQSVNVMVDEDPRTQITVTHTGEVFASGQYRIRLPYSDAVFQVQELSSMFLLLSTKDGLLLHYNWKELRLYLRVEPTWKDDTIGLCGTFNGNIQDDFLSPAGMIESSPQLFGNSWKVSSACVPNHHLHQFDPCDAHQQAALYASEMCDVLNREPFSLCHRYLSPGASYQQCKSDTCKCGETCLCASLAHYARQCRKYGVGVDFRGRLSECAARCPETMEYGACVSSCHRSCRSLSAPDVCSQECAEGCVCPDGTFYSSVSRRCVTRSQCSCHYLGAEYTPGEIVVTSSGTRVCKEGLMILENPRPDTTCPPGQLYFKCDDAPSVGTEKTGVPCERTCESHLLNLTCPGHTTCQSGCVCPHGFLKHGDKCFQPSECPCLWKGKEFYPGERVSSACHSCVCQHGSFQCVFHPCPSMCTAYGDRHFRTFDGLLFDYIGACRVYLVKSGDELPLSVAAENVDCYDSGVICRKSLSINIGRSFVVFDSGSGEPSPASLIDKRQQLFIWQAGFYTIVHAPMEDITVLWDHHTTIHVQAGPRWQGKLTGLCGNFDLKTANEMLTPENMESATPQEFGNSWTTAECVNSPDIRNPCSVNPLREPFAKTRCAILLGDVFEACHSLVDVTWFYLNCLSDTCGCSRGGDCECFCTSVAAYAHRCCQHGIATDWRSPDVCPYDCEYHNKVLGNGPFFLITYLDSGTMLAANLSGGLLFPVLADVTLSGLARRFMLTPGLSQSRPHDLSLVSLEAADRPNYFVQVRAAGGLALTKWQEGSQFEDESTFVIHRDTWIEGYDSFESYAHPGLFLHYMGSGVHLMKYEDSDGFRRATLFKLSEADSESPLHSSCQWRYDSCSSACFRSCSDPTGETCHTIPKVEGCVPRCPHEMVLDEVTRRCVYVQDCIRPPVAAEPLTPHSTPPTPGSVTSAVNASEPASVTPSATLPSTGASQVTTSTPSPVTSVSPAVTNATRGPSSPVTSQPPSTEARHTLSPASFTMSSSRVESWSTSHPAEPPESPTPLPTTTGTLPPSSPVPVESTTSWTASSGTEAVVTAVASTKQTTPWKWSSSSTRTMSPYPTFSTGITVLPETESTTGSAPTTRTTTSEQTAMFSTTVTLTTEGTPSTLRTERTSPTSSLPTTDTSAIGSTTEVGSPAVSATESTTSGPSRSVTTPAAVGLTTETVTTTEVSTSKVTTHSSPLQPTETSPSASPGLSQTTTPTASMASSLPSVRYTGTPTTEERTSEGMTTTPKDEGTSAGLSTTPSTTLVASATPRTSEVLSTRVTPDKTPSPSPGRWDTEGSTAGTTATKAITTMSTATTSEALREPQDETPLTPTTTSWRTSASPSASFSTATSSTNTTMTYSVPSKATTEATTTSSSSEVTSLRAEHETDSAGASMGTIRPTASTTPPPSLPTTTTTTTTQEGSSSTSEVTSELMTLSPLTTPPSMTTMSSTGLPAPGSTSPAVTSTAAAESLSASSPLSPKSTVPAEGTSSRTEQMEKETTVATQPSWWHSTSFVTVTPTTPSPEMWTSSFTVATTLPVLKTSLSTPTSHTTSTGAPRETTRQTVNATEGTMAATLLSTSARMTQSHSYSSTAASTMTQNQTAQATTSEGPHAPPNVTEITGSTWSPRADQQTTHLSSPAATSTSTEAPQPDSTPSQTAQQTTLKETTGTTRTISTGAPMSSSVPSKETMPSESWETPLSNETLAEVTTIAATSTPPVVTTELTTLLASSTATQKSRGTTTQLETDEMWTSPTFVFSSEQTSSAVTASRMCTPPYTEIIDECTKYVCMNGQLMLFNKSQNCPYNATPPNCGLLGFAVLVNGDKCCPQWDCPCRCSVFPDLNVITFDGNSVAVYKAASYIITQLPNETVSIHVQECQSSDVLFWNFTNLCLAALNITHRPHQVLIDRLQRRIFVNSRYARPRFKKYGFEILDTGNMYLIRTPAGLKIQWFHSTGMMIIETDSASSKPTTMGLCGCCDGDPKNDLTLSNGTTVRENEDPAVFIDSWQVPNTTSFMGQNRRREVNCSTSDCSECLSMLSNQTFSGCHAFVPPKMFCEVWVRDAEYVKNPCIALAAYVAACHKFSVCIEWRSPDYCSFVCPPELRYQACLPACNAKTCPTHEFDSEPEDCSGLTEGCVCPEGTLLHRPYSALCIPFEKCACTDSSGTPRAAGEIWKASKDGCCMYKCDNDTIVPVEHNCTDAPEPVCRKTGEVVVSLSDTNSCCPQKSCVCNHTLCEGFALECKFGEKLVSYYREDSCCPDVVCECDPDRCESEIPVCREDQVLIATRADGTCCMAYICTCRPCPDGAPSCQDGEVLTVDVNTTERCCPTYHCVCETYRCEEHRCPRGMAVVTVWSPGQCCPLRTCECACDAVPKPQCDLGETLQIDLDFLADPENRCGCTSYTCVKEPVCVDGQRGAMRPGQTLVEHTADGVCFITECTSNVDPITGFHKVQVSHTNCSGQCQPNQVYEAPRHPGLCCGVCRNVSCISHTDNGTAALVKPGASWVSSCIKYDCVDTQSGPTLISYPVSCPPFNESECTKIGGTLVNYMDGCCKTCKEDGKSCQKVTVRMTIRKNDCRSNRPVNIVSCDGKCPSASIYNYNINTYARFCKCCREIGLQRRSVQLYCSSNATWVSYSIQEPTDCACQWS
ncbi:otogelin [Polypterus senegalus]|uniref:otogelin n=1 Tax=Polypterus senegalus TaxID=55291 RepID=UPI00196503D7|nr:otogelin [Polypterus senegalus]